MKHTIAEIDCLILSSISARGQSMSNNWLRDYICARDGVIDSDPAGNFSNKVSVLFLWIKFRGSKQDVTIEL